MKKWFVGLVLLLCLVLCCAGGLAENTVAVAEFNAFLDVLNNSTYNILLANPITFESDVTINRDVKILYEDKDSIKGNGFTLTIAEGCTVTMGTDVGGNSKTPYTGKVYVNVVNHGTLQGSTTFQGTVTNDGTIAAAHRFCGTYVNAGGTNSSTVNVTFDFGGVIVREYE